ncbi:MAG TPA: universal stress protein [Solirubrobacteraceae bacterium]|jgi:nucleotide-binding universal stress UspA family protein|nr:universal stress protein [Solirubrobacteraceae bacterium]
MAQVIVSYDGTRNDRDALALGRLFSTAGAHVTLAYVRHAAESDPTREANVQEEAERLLAAGAEQLDGVQVGQKIVLNASTADGLAGLAEELDAELLAFGSSYRTPAGHVELSHTAEQLLEGEVACSLAIAPAGLRRVPVERSIGTISVYDEDGDEAAKETATSLAHALGAVITDGEGDLLMIASRPGAPAGRVAISAAAREQAERAAAPVVLLAGGATFSFD